MRHRETEIWLKIFKVISGIFLSLAIFVAVSLTLLRAIFGFNSYSVLSNSMSPAFSVGSLVYVKPTVPESLEVGDVITFMASEDTTVTHRIVEIYPDAEEGVLRFETKGDANFSSDQNLVHESNIIGRVAFSLPLLGFLATFLKTTPGFFLIAALGVVFLSLVFFPSKPEKSAKSPKSSRTRKSLTPANLKKRKESSQRKSRSTV